MRIWAMRPALRYWRAAERVRLSKKLRSLHQEFIDLLL